MHTDGGGASHSTEPAAGTSAATDVSLYAHLVGMMRAERVLTDQMIAAQAAMARANRDGDTEAVKTAFAASQALTEAHNGLLRKMELQAAADRETFATREALDRRMGAMGDRVETGQKAMGALVEKGQDDDDARFKRIEAWQAKATGGLLIVSAIGITNFVKVWT